MGHPPGIAKAILSYGCIFLFLFLATASANQCNVGCHGMQANKGYQEGRTYVYDLEGSSVTSVSEAQGEATLKLKATVELSVKPDCVQQLRLKGVQLNGAPVPSEDVEKYAVQFNLHSGHIDTELCTENEDSQSSLNIKRAVVSMFQSAVMQDSGSTTHHEVDIFGGCPTDFVFHKEGDSLIVEKYRNLGQCSYRENFNQGLITSSFDSTSDVHSTPLLASTQKMEQRFKRGVLNKAVSTETYNFKPFSNGDAGAKTVVETTLTLKNEKADNPTAPVSRPKSIIFEVPHPVVKTSVEKLSNALKAAKAELVDGVKPEAASKFAELVKALRVSSKNDILSVYQKIRAGAGFDKVSDQTLFLDALFRAASGESVEVAVELIKNREISGIQSLVFYASLPLVAHINLPAVTSVTSLLDQPNLSRSAYLGIGHVIGKYCQQHSCDNVPEIKEAVHKIREKVGNGKSKTREQENVVVSALKALQNSKYMDDATLQKLANIAADKNVKNRVRVAAIKALPGRCSMKWKNILMKVYADLSEDTEIRIESYLALTACPCPHVANHIRKVLDSETMIQVGSFVQNHLRNLRHTTNPNKQEAKKHLGQIMSPKRYPEDLRKYSFNDEVSYHIDAFGVGSSMESTVIYSQNSYVPRSANLNLTAEIFGQSFNFLELNARAENLDRVLEQYFGPKGKLTTYDVENLAKDSISSTKDFSKYVQERYEKAIRGKREVKQGELDRFAKSVHLRDNALDENLDVDLSFKLFGTEIGYLNFQGDVNEVSPQQLVDKVFDNLEKGFGAAKEFNYELQNHLHFMDAELVYPTGLGAGLSLGVTGTSVVHMKTSGKLDIPAMLKNPKSAGFRFALEPSASVRVAGSINVQQFGVDSGLKIISTLHTSTGSDVSVSMLDGKGIDINFGIPKKKQELISISSEILMSSGPKGQSYVAPKFGGGKEYSDCFEQFSSILGLTVCGQLSFPYENVESVQKKPIFPLSGPAKFSLSVESNDVSSFHFKVYADTDKPNVRSFEILVDTPNSKTNRHLSLLAEAGTEPNKYVKLSLDSPIRKVSVEGVLKDTEKERSLTFTLLNDNVEYFLRSGLLASGNKYKPILEYKVPEHIERLTSSKLGGKQSGNGQLYNVEGTVDVSDVPEGKKFVFDNVALVAGDKKLLGLTGTAESTLNTALVDMNVVYADDSVALKLDGKRLAPRNYEVSLSAMPSKNPEIGFNLKWNWLRTDKEFDHKLTFVHGSDPNSKINRLTLEQHSTYKLDMKNLDLSTSNKLTYRALNLLLKLDGQLTPKSLKGDIEVKYEKFKFGTEVSVKRNTVKPGDYDVEFEAEILNNSLELKAKRTVVDNRKSKFKNSLVLSPGGKYDVDAVVTYDVSKNNINLQLDGDANLDGKKIKVDTGLEANPQLVNSHALVNIDDVKYVDFLLKLQRGQNPNGNLNLNLKDYLSANGQFGYQAGKGSSNLNIDIPKINRKIKATGDLAISGSQHVANVEILYDADKDPSKRIKFSTISDITKTTVDTKNVIEILAYKVELNGNGKLQGTLHDGQLLVNADLTLPNGRYLTYKTKRNSAKKDEKYDVSVQLELADSLKKGGDTRKLIYNGETTGLDLKSKYGIITGQVKLVDFDEKNVELKWYLKRLPQGDQNSIGEVKIDLSGSRIPRPFHLELGAACGKKDASLKGKASLGNDLAVQGSGSYSNGEGTDQPSTLDYTVEVMLPSEKLKSLKLEHKESFLQPTAAGGVYELDSTTGLTYNNDKTIKVEAYGKMTDQTNPQQPGEGSGKLTITILKNPPLTIGGSCKYDPTGDKKKAAYTLNINYGDSEATVSTNTEILPDLSYIKMDAQATLPFAKLKKVDLHLNHQSENDGKRRKTDIALSTDDAKYTGMSDLQLDDTTKMLHTIFTCPNSKAEVLLKSEKHGEYKGEWKVHTPEGYVVADALVNLESVDSFVINANFDSDRITPSKIHAEITNKPTARNGKRIVITVTSDGKNIVTGSTNYKRRDEDGKIIVEGNGSLKIGENVRSSSFKYTRQELTHETDGEVGVAMVLNANFGPSAIVGELKLSNKEVHVFNSYCEQNKDCAHFKLQSTLDTDHKTLLKHQITLEVDLKKFNVPAEFGLKTNTEYKTLTFDHTASLYLHSSKDKSEYSYQIYAHPKDSAIILTLPSREMALIATFDLPKTKKTGAYKLDCSLYLDRKNKPSEKTSLTATGDMNIDKNSISLNGETRFTYPSQTKDMAVTGRLHYGGDHLLDANVDIDVFAKKSQKIMIIAKVQKQSIQDGYNTTSVVEVLSRGQQLKIDLKSHLTLSTKEIGFGSFLTYNDVHQKPKSVGALFSADMKHIFLLITLPNKELIRSESNMEFSRDLQKIDTELAIVGNKPIVFNFEVNGLNSFKYLEYAKDEPNTKLTANGRVVLGQLAEIHADAYKDGEKKNLFHALIHLDDEKFLKPDFGMNKDNIMKVVEHTRNRQIEYLKQLKDVISGIGDEAQRELKDLLEHLKKAQPNIKPLVDYYQTELKKLENELHADETIKEIQATLNKHFGSIVVAITESAKQLAERFAEIQKEYVELFSKISEMMKSLYPTLRDTYKSIAHSIIEVLEAFGNLFMVYIKAALTIINQHQKELKEIGAVISEFAQDVAKIIFKAAGQMKQDLQEFVNLLINQLKVLPIYEILKEKYGELSQFQIPEGIINPIQEICNLVKSALPTQELQDLFDVTCHYIIKHIKREKVDDATEIKRIYSLAVSAIQSVISLLRSQATMGNVFGFVQTRMPIDLGWLSKLPGIVTLRLSPISLLRSGELQSLSEVYYAYRPTLHASDIVAPFKMLGQVSNGGHIFTFDGRHFTFPGSCHYILAQDMQDGNFSIVANMNNGNLLSVTITEPKESITIKSNGNILVNNKPAEYPAYTKNMHAFLQDTLVMVKSNYGVLMGCSQEQGMFCFFEISGFYFGKIRGLCGDGNYEPYDDYTLPNGKIVQSATEFGNAYKLKANCPAATAVEHGKSPRAPICTEYFSGEATPLKSCFNYVSPVQYREACDDAVAAGTKDAGCLIAANYYSRCYEQRIFVNLPTDCTKCKVGGNELEIGSSFSVKIPKKEADIVFVVEQDIRNEKIFKEMITPLMNELRDELKQHGLTDVHIGLIGFGAKMKWPQHYTTGGSANIEGDVKNMKFDETEPLITLQEAKEGDIEKKLTYLGQRLDVELGTFKLTDAYEEAIRYPFRPGAAKAVVGVIANPCEKSPFPISFQHLRILLGQKMYRDLGLTYYHISFPNELLVSGKPQKNIVGYDQDSVYTFADSKKKPLSGNSELKNNLVTTTNDVCADFAVSSGGAAFSSDNYQDAKPNQKKQFVQVTARRIVDGLTGVEIEEDCTCEQRMGAIGTPRCKIVSRNEKEHLARHSKGGAKG